MQGRREELTLISVCLTKHDPPDDLLGNPTSTAFKRVMLDEFFVLMFILICR